ncbi:arabinofuranosyltransferase [Nocardia sp. NPDC050630]|uniref:arabinofuranosyltransferase n=1 Tax=Nocardia sp. NPDC050630 TaxID=3364321 RepID=UPI00378E870E
MIRHIGSGVGEALLAAVVAALVAAIGLVAFSMVQWPAFNSSNVTRSLTTVGQVGAAVLLGVAIRLVRARRWPWVAKLLSWVGISTFVTVTLGMPLAATKLYLFGVSVDQEFRTEYLTRLTDSAALHDMTYVDLPPFYPAGWFWIGGRVANVLGMDGWEAFKPYAIGSLAVVAVIALVLWSKLIRADWAIGVSAATTAVTVAYASPEAYSAVIVLLLPPALILAWGALYRPLERSGGTVGEVASSGARASGGAAASAVAATASHSTTSHDAATAGNAATPGSAAASAVDSAADSAAVVGTATSGGAASGSAASGSAASGSAASGSAATSGDKGAAGGEHAAASSGTAARSAPTNSSATTASGIGTTGDVGTTSGDGTAGGVGTAGGWGAVIGAGLFLGMAASFYTLYFAVAAFAVGLMGLVSAGLAVRAQRVASRAQRGGADSIRWAVMLPLVRLIVIAAIAGLVALVVWLPFVVKMLGGSMPSSGTAFHYLPEGGAQLPLPMAEFSLSGAFFLLGTVWLVLRAASSRRAQALGIGVVAIYLWCLLSMTATAAGTTLLSFRLTPVLEVLLAAAGAFGFVEGAREAYRALNEAGRFKFAVVVVAIVGALAFTQDIPQVLKPEITTAYTDTDGNGERADKRAPGAASYYREIDAALIAQTGRPRSDSVVLTADTSFLSFYPYYGFQALTSHYANPLADFAGRAATIESWSKLNSSAALVEALDKSPWRAPDAFLFRSSGDTYTLRLAKDVYPNDPNVKRYTVSFPKELFADPHFTTTNIGPFTLVVVNR